MAEYYVRYCETAEVAIVSMSKCHEFQIDRDCRINTRVAALSYGGVQVDHRSPSQGQLSGKHAFHEPVLRSCAALSNPLHPMLGHGSVYEFVRDVKDSRNKLLFSVPSINL
ncbi:hypothetical protein N7G274_007316 [Stereocaulon virgatum]|uniref:Uncharacterized protein n=1 Tax=Stereocaulon virgatum TaxID=373712 RepID=A0ABR4A2N8_9LECA